MNNIFLEEIDSTNRYAKSNIEKLKDRTIVQAARQTAGRGRLQRCWIDLGDDNLFLTFVLKPSQTFLEVYSNLTQYLSVILCKILEKYDLQPQIKWPNDVLVDGKKIAGILSETVMQGNAFKGLVLGIGVNINADEKELEKIDRPVTSLNLQTGKSIDLKEFKDMLVNDFFENYEIFLKEGFSYIKEYYINHASFLEKEICVQILNEKKSGMAKSITDKGELVLEKDNKDLVLTIGDIL